MFGTDGVRGTPGRAPLDAGTIARLGAATARVVTGGGRAATLLAVRDTRESGGWVEQQLARGVSDAGGTLVSAGVLPTPAAAFLVPERGLDGALVISASHNPFPDNGIKVLTAAGEKASEDLETEIERVVADDSWAVSDQTAPRVDQQDFAALYQVFAKQVLDGCDAMRPLRIVADCANGAMSTVAPAVLRELGFHVTALGVEPDGRNINAGCGSTHPERLQRRVVDDGADVGLAFDGDGDRVIMVDRHGGLVDGDAMLFICARFLHARGRLPNSAIVATVMSNIGLELGLRAAGITLHRCPVGDRQVREAMVKRGVQLGGEQSGHVIFSTLLPTGDGLLTALSVIRASLESGRGIDTLREELEIYPQVLLNVTVASQPALETEPAIMRAIDAAEQVLGSEGRVLVRYSGTEPLLRVMIEGKDPVAVQRLAADIADTVRERLGEGTESRR